MAAQKPSPRHRQQQHFQNHHQHHHQHQEEQQEQYHDGQALAHQQQQQLEAPPSSRLCVKNLPKYLQEQRLKDHFSAKGQVTDVKVLKTRDGQPRQMAFVGYRSVEDAAAALRYFNNTFIDTSRISIEYARRYRAYEPPAAAAAATGPDAQAPAAADAHRPWSKYSAGSSKHDQLLAKQQAAAAAAAGPDAQAAAAAADAKAARKLKKDKKAQQKQRDGAVAGAAAADPKLAEFLQLMQPRAKAKIWSNDEVLPAQGGKAGKAAAAKARAPAADMMAVDGADEDEEDELYEDLPAAAAAAGAASSGSESDGSESDDDDDAAEQLAAKDAVVVDEGVSDLDYLRARMRKAPTAAAGAGSDSNDEDGSSSSDDEFDDEGAAAHAERRQRRHAASTSGSSGSESEGGSGSDGVVLPWKQQQKQKQRAAAAAAGGGKQQQQQPGSDSEGLTESGDAEEEQEGSEEPASDDEAAAAGAAAGDPMAVDPDEQQQQQHGFVGANGAEAAAAEAAVRESGRLFVRNLAYTAGQLELSELFGQHGDLEEVHLVLDRDTRRSKGIAYVKYLLPEDAVAAFRALDMTPFQGRLLHVLPAKRKPGEDQQEPADNKQGPAGFKADREAQRKRDAGNRSAWSTLFMRSDTVAAVVAAHYGVSKAQLLDASAEDLPLRMALGEAQVIAQTKAALADAGINTKALEAAAAASGSAAATKSVARSSTSLLVKNLPYGADAEELQHMLTGPQGRGVARLVLPPTKTLAVVEFVEPQDARAAFKALAYKKYQQVPLYLEWAPRDIWDTPPPAAPLSAARGAAAAAAAGGAGDGATPAAAAGGKAAAAAVPAAPAAAEDEDGDAEQAPVVSIYVKNLNFSTSDASLKFHFDRVISAAGGQIHSAKVARRKGPDGKLLSMGYGFVETDSEAVAKAAIKQLQGSMLDKHKLTLQLSKRTSSSSTSSQAGSKRGKEAAGGSGKGGSSSSKGTKLVVRNVAFEATRKDIMGLFGPFGHIKSCRLPKKFDGNHRGFAFLEFTTKQEAANALDGVGGTHLYGRRLVVEYAQADSEEGAGLLLTATGEAADLQAARAKTAAKFYGAGGGGGDAEGGGDGGGAAVDAPARKRMRRNL